MASITINGMKAWVVDSLKDNVATILDHDMRAGTTLVVQLDGKTVEFPLIDCIPYGHKVALVTIKKGETVYKYGASIGRSTVDIRQGEHIHTHNIEPLRGRGDLAH
jgi:altronate dehydratase small subunit